MGAIASALLGLVSAEADPALLYAGYPYVGLKSAPCVNAANVPVPCAAGYGYGLVHYGKRDSEADPALFYAGYYGVPFGSSTGLDPITQGLDASTQGYAPYGYFGHYYGKRDAEADPALLVAGYGYAAFPHGVAATPAGYIHSSHVGLCVNYLGASVPC